LQEGDLVKEAELAFPVFPEVYRDAYGEVSDDGLIFRGILERQDDPHDGLWNRTGHDSYLTCVSSPEAVERAISIVSDINFGANARHRTARMRGFRISNTEVLSGWNSSLAALATTLDAPKRG